MAEQKRRLVPALQRIVAAGKRWKAKRIFSTTQLDLFDSTLQSGFDIISRKRFLCASILLGISMTSAFLIHTEAAPQNVYKVYFHHAYLGMVHSKQELEQKLASLHMSHDIGFTYEAVTLSSTTKFDPLNEKRLSDEISPVVIQVNHKPIVTVADRQDAEEVMKNVEQFYLKDHPSDAKVSVEDTIDYIPVRDATQIKSVSDAVHELLAGADTPQTYIVSRGDTLWDIAQRENVTVEKLLSSNPSLTDENNLQLGQQLIINKREPVVHIRVEETVTKDVTVPFTTQYIDDDTMATGDTKVVTQGQDGLETQTLHIVYENGNVVKKDVLSRTVKKEMVQAVVKRGTNSGIASGAYIWPVASHVITSPYGENRGYEIHPGVDIGSYTGAPIWASNNGTVIFAGWDSGGYGYCVRIDHGNGVVSIYGHMSRVDVQVGQRVTKGQQIGAVGMTGEATGPHLHYEVHVNGVRVNPAPYM
jgi:murein DD-endopeptidase MepM/ murein hydrolase activator NlpD